MKKINKPKIFLCKGRRGGDVGKLWTSVFCSFCRHDGWKIMNENEEKDENENEEKANDDAGNENCLSAIPKKGIMVVI